jgi:hypothetical protein
MGKAKEVGLLISEETKNQKDMSGKENGQFKENHLSNISERHILNWGMPFVMAK